MLTVYICAAVLFVVLATGGSLRRLADVRIRHAWLLWAALADQILIISVLPDAYPVPLAIAHVASYLAAGLCLWSNRDLPGAWLIAGGGALNGVVIALNGGTLPASAGALDAAGRAGDTGHFTNSALLAHPRLAMLGDIFATPPWLPGHSVFSLGDLGIWLGVAVFAWRTCRYAAPGRHRHGPPGIRRPGARPAPRHRLRPELSGSGPA
jgi:hypothetical protein